MAQLRFAVHSGSLGKSGSVYHDVEIPDFRKQQVSLSGVVIGVEPALPAAPRGFLASVTPVSPTTQRSFARPDRATAFLRVYQREKKPPVPAALTTTILDEADRQVHAAAEALDPVRFAGGQAVDHRMTLPLDRLEPGSYLLRFELTAGKVSSRREVRFLVR